MSKKLAAMVDKIERTVQNYKAGQTDFTISILKNITIVLDINYRELLATKEYPYKPPSIVTKENPQDKYHLDSFSDIVNILFQIEPSQSILMKLDIKKPPKYSEQNTSISVDGNGTRRYDILLSFP